MIKSGPVVIMNPLVLSLSLGVHVTIQSLYTVNQNGDFNSKIIGEKQGLHGRFAGSLRNMYWFFFQV